MGGMNGDGNLALLPELLDHSFGPGPSELPTPAQRLAEGRRVLGRRRRLGLVATSVAVAAAIGVGVALTGPGGERGADGPPATSGTSPSVSPSEDSSEDSSEDRQRALDRLAKKAREQAHRVEQRQVSNQFPATYGTNGTIIVKDGWRITDRVAEPMGQQPPGASVGLAVTDGAHTRWLLIIHEPAEDEAGHALPGAFSDSVSADDAGKGYSRFEDWLASMVDLQGGASTPPLVTVNADDTLEPGAGATVVATVPAPVIEGYTTDGDRMARVQRDGRTWFVVVRGHGREAEVIPVDAEVLSAPTFEAFVDHLTTQASSGEGVR
jgi:hypothetical protein